jgi:hypothetical protein
MGPTELDALQLTGAEEFVDCASTDIEEVSSTLGGDRQSVIEIDKMSVATLAHGD